jgi:mRNA interferase MazF
VLGLTPLPGGVFLLLKNSKMNISPYDGNNSAIIIINKEMKFLVVKRGDIYYADLRPVIGSEQGGIRPVLIIQNDMGNRYSPTVICAAITSKMNKAKLPTHVALDAEKYGIVKDSVILLEQVRTIDKSRLREWVCHLDSEILTKIDVALQISFSLNTYTPTS